MKKFLKKNMKVVLAFIFGSIITGSIVYATIINSSDIVYDNTNSGITSTNMQGAIDELYTKAKEGGGNRFRVEYDKCGGTGTVESTNHQYGIKSNITTSKPTKENYVFQGWSKTSCSGSVDYSSGAEIALIKEGDTTTIPLYAIWKLSSCEYKCSNGFYATYTNGTMTSCRYSGAYGSAVCNGGSTRVSSLYMCKLSSSTYDYPYSYCNMSIDNPYIGGGGCPSSYTCP